MPKLLIFTDVLIDKGSKYAVSGAPAVTRADTQSLIKALKKQKKFNRASHHSWALISSKHGPLKNDDGEAGAGMVMLRMLEREGLTDHMVIVTRWYGGTKLGADRFKHIITCVNKYLGALA